MSTRPCEGAPAAGAPTDPGSERAAPGSGADSLPATRRVTRHDRDQYPALQGSEMALAAAPAEGRLVPHDHRTAAPAKDAGRTWATPAALEQWVDQSPAAGPGQLSLPQFRPLRRLSHNHPAAAPASDGGHAWGAPAAPEDRASPAPPRASAHQSPQGAQGSQAQAHQSPQKAQAPQAQVHQPHQQSDADHVWAAMEARVVAVFVTKRQRRTLRCILKWWVQMRRAAVSREMRRCREVLSGSFAGWSWVVRHLRAVRALVVTARCSDACRWRLQRRVVVGWLKVLAVKAFALRQRRLVRSRFFDLWRLRVARAW